MIINLLLTYHEFFFSLLEQTIFISFHVKVIILFEVLVLAIDCLKIKVVI